MATVDPLFAQWLQRAADYVVRTDAIMTGRWNETALVAERTTGIATAAGAEDEARREFDFWSRSPFAIDVHEVVGSDWRTSLGRVITIRSEDLGYQAGRDVFVIGVEADRSRDLSALTVLCPLGVGNE